MAMIRLTRWALRQTKPVLIAIGLIGALLIGALDLLTGYEISFGVFYLAPIFLVSWGVGRKAALPLSVFSAILWLVADIGSGHAYSNPAFPYWNAAVRLGFFAVVADLAGRLKETHQKESLLARLDFLTGLPNRRAFLEIAERESRRTRRHRYSVTVAYLDLDNFKFVNDRFGHNVGDQLLQVVARTIREHMRETDVAARLGGDEFAVLLPETNLDGAKKYLEKLRSCLLQSMQERAWPVTFSIGSITFSRFVSVDEMIKRADSLMYAVKHNSKDAINYELTQGKSFTQGNQEIQP
ncbi:MAG: GGDEF domain-containing protein [Acidobacteria bacterium]|nr:GGDEF domain-containing protein [Acidobacteriota bacterium]